MLWTIEPGAKVTRGYIRFPNGIFMRLLRECNKETWIYARDVYKVMEVSEDNYLRTLFKLNPECRALLSPDTCNEKTWVNLVTIKGAFALAELASQGDCSLLAHFLADFSNSYCSPGSFSSALLWEQDLFGEEEEDEQKCPAGV